MNYFNKKEINNIESDDLPEYIRTESQINKDIFKLKIKQFLLNFHHFPTLLVHFFRKTFFGLLKLLGVIVL